MDSQELANRAVKYLAGHDRKQVKIAVLNACTESTELIPQEVIDEATARIMRGISVADRVKVALK